MACTNPLHAWEPNEYTRTGKLKPVFKLEKGNKYNPIQLPCGKCPGCRADQRRDWGVRCFHESQMHEQSAFITLTYRDAPPRLDKYHLDIFLKRLRNNYGKVRYFACGEYGGKTGRPHYHMLLFGHDFSGGRYVAQKSETRYTNLAIEKLWEHGEIDICRLTPETCFYTAGYCLKKSGDRDTFAIQSRKPPIGYDWVSNHWDNMRRLGHVVINGQINPIPRTYYRWMEQELEPVKLKKRQFLAKVGSYDKYEKLKSGVHRQINLEARHKQEPNPI